METPEVQLLAWPPGRRVPECLRRGAVCILARARKPYGPARFWLDRVVATTTTRKTGRYISEVESGASPIALGHEMHEGPWDKPRWFTYAMSSRGRSAPHAVRARAMWDDYVAAGKPAYRSRSRMLEFLERYAIRP